jgi:hypothetical protein
LKAEIIDKIKAAGDVGASSAELAASDLYRDRRPVRPKTIGVHIFQLNELLCCTSFRIRSDGGRWILVKEKSSHE